MPRKLTITLTCSNRADYLREVLDTIKNADKTDIDILFLPSIDYNSQKVVDIINSVDFLEKEVFIHNPKLGCNQNTLFAINRGMQYGFSDYVLHLEDDTPITKDSLQYFMYSFNKYASNKNVISVGGYNKTEDFVDSEIYEIFTQSFFSAWGCGFWKSKWDIFVKHWSKSHSNFDMSWDSHLHEVLFTRQLFLQARPKISRIQNIGAINGTWVQDPAWHYYNHRSPYLSNDFEGNIDWIQYAKNN